jgi:hypothetical protein
MLVAKRKFEAIRKPKKLAIFIVNSGCAIIKKENQKAIVNKIMSFTCKRLLRKEDRSAIRINE